MGKSKNDKKQSIPGSSRRVCHRPLQCKQQGNYVAMKQEKCKSRSFRSQQDSATPTFPDDLESYFRGFLPKQQIDQSDKPSKPNSAYKMLTNNERRRQHVVPYQSATGGIFEPVYGREGNLTTEAEGDYGNKRIFIETSELPFIDTDQTLSTKALSVPDIDYNSCVVGEMQISSDSTQENEISFGGMLKIPSQCHPSCDSNVHSNIGSLHACTTTVHTHTTQKLEFSSSESNLKCDTPANQEGILSNDDKRNDHADNRRVCNNLTDGDQTVPTKDISQDLFDTDSQECLPRTQDRVDSQLPTMPSLLCRKTATNTCASNLNIIKQQGDEFEISLANPTPGSGQSTDSEPIPSSQYHPIAVDKSHRSVLIKDPHLGSNVEEKFKNEKVYFMGEKSDDPCVLSKLTEDGYVSTSQNSVEGVDGNQFVPDILDIMTCKDIKMFLKRRL